MNLEEMINKTVFLFYFLEQKTNSRKWYKQTVFCDDHRDLYGIFTWIMPISRKSLPNFESSRVIWDTVLFFLSRREPFLTKRSFFGLLRCTILERSYSSLKRTIATPFSGNIQLLHQISDHHQFVTLIVIPGCSWTQRTLSHLSRKSLVVYVQLPDW